MSDIMNMLFGPLNKEYCLYFYYLSIFGFFLLTLAIIGTISLAIKGKRTLAFYVNSFLILFGYGIFYFQNRLLHTMCSNSL